MRKTNRLLIGSAVLATMLGAHGVHGDVRHTTSARRPYIVELGEPYSINSDTLDGEARKNSDMRAYLSRYGWPEYAEIQEVMPEWPWESYEVRLFYLRRNLEVDFSHVVVSRALTDYGLQRYQGTYPEPEAARDRGRPRGPKRPTRTTARCGGPSRGRPVSRTSPIDIPRRRA